MLETIERAPIGIADSTVIWLHGLGADGNDFVPIVPELNLPDTLCTRFIFPHAPVQAVTLNSGMRMRAWYDIFDINFERPREDLAGITASANLIIELITREKSRGVPASRIVLAGFSQGAAMALHVGLRYPETLAGIMALSGYLPLAYTLPTESSPANQQTPIFMAHGLYDDIVRISAGEQSKQYLEGEKHSVEWYTYPMTHSVCADEINAVRGWLLRVLQK